MKQLRPYPQAVVTKKAARAISAGHPWVFEGEVRSLEPSPATGEAATNRSEEHTSELQSPR